MTNLLTQLTEKELILLLVVSSLDDTVVTNLGLNPKRLQDFLWRATDYYRSLNMEEYTPEAKERLRASVELILDRLELPTEYPIQEEVGVRPAIYHDTDAISELAKLARSAWKPTFHPDITSYKDVRYSTTAKMLDKTFVDKVIERYGKAINKEYTLCKTS